jgi:hypothetical protein
MESLFPFCMKHGVAFSVLDKAARVFLSLVHSWSESKPAGVLCMYAMTAYCILFNFVNGFLKIPGSSEVPGIVFPSVVDRRPESKANWRVESVL